MGSVAVASVLADQPVLTQMLGFLQAAALAVKKGTVQGTVGVVNARNTVCVPGSDREDFQQQYAGRKEEKLDRLQCGRAGGRRGVRHSGAAAVRLCDRRGVRQKSLQRGSGLPRYGNLQTGRDTVAEKQ